MLSTVVCEPWVLISMASLIGFSNERGVNKGEVLLVWYWVQHTQITGTQRIYDHTDAYLWTFSTAFKNVFLSIGILSLRLGVAFN